jgi:hypothetical protein
MARSPNYPAVSLADAIELATKIFESEHQASMTHEVAAAAMGYGALHGPARRKLAALRTYGLLDSSGATVRISREAIAILHPRDEAERQAAIRSAAMRPELFRELASEPHASDANLTSMLIRRGFLPEGARKAVTAYRETISLLGRPEGESQGGDDLSEPSSAAWPTGSQGDVRSESTEAATAYGTRAAEFVWLLPKGVKAYIRITGGDLTRESLAVLRRYLDVMELAIPEVEAADPDM